MNTAYIDEDGEEITWVTKEGRKMYLEEMGHSHLVNCKNVLERTGRDVIRSGGGSCPEDFWYDEEPNPTYHAILAEIRKREATHA